DAVTHEVVVENLRAQGFVRVQADGPMLHLEEMKPGTVDLTQTKELFVVVDRLEADDAVRGRLADAVASAFREGDGDCAVLLSESPPSTDRAEGAGREPKTLRFTKRFECPDDGTRAPTPSPQLFSFNSPRGACAECNGFGAILEYDEALIVPHPERSLKDGAIDPWTMPRYDNKRRALAEFAKREKIPMDKSWRTL